VDRRGSRVATAFVVVSLVHLVAQATAASAVQVATKPLLIPLLLGWFLLATPPHRLRRIVGAALGLSWLGDLALMRSGETWFLLGLGAFLLAHVAYLVAFWPDRGASVLRRPPRLAPYVVVLVGLLLTLWPDLDGLRAPVAGYAIVIVAMAVLATGLGSTTAAGAALFVLSDALLALGSLTGRFRLPAHGAWVMATYLAGQALLALGIREVVRRRTSSAAGPTARGAPARPPG
jgi:uncharacterized membrane protein YhhN